MIISASRRTDIPALYSEWFFQRIKEKHVLVRNPVSYHQISRVSLLPDIVDCIVFWTKNPKPMLDRLDLLKDYDFYFQFALNPYANEIECSLPPKSLEIIDTFKALSDMIGPERVVWRYSPLLLSDKYTMEYHVEYFEKIAIRLCRYTKQCMLSFLDMYPKIKDRMEQRHIAVPTEGEKRYAAAHFSEIAKQNDIEVESCSEFLDLTDEGVLPGKCIDDRLIGRITGEQYNLKKDKNQRPQCGCVPSIDIGAYNTCTNGCLYCYANRDRKKAQENHIKHHPASPLLCSALGKEDKISERKTDSLKVTQLKLF
ncbi:DUF1848 domain-containing protein [Christensenellaceae bacterium OttesenSCG-928-K19]|nr:DUF1848 domain-containing protein [Christensenellaceae bacterium OttesenSCG-928-K19]